MKNRCREFAKYCWTEAGLKLKDISCVPCAGDWFVEIPKHSQEIHAHCKWCAIAEVVTKVD